MGTAQQWNRRGAVMSESLATSLTTSSASRTRCRTRVAYKRVTTTTTTTAESRNAYQTRSLEKRVVALKERRAAEIFSSQIGISITGREPRLGRSHGAVQNSGAVVVELRLQRRALVFVNGQYMLDTAHLCVSFHSIAYLVLQWCAKEVSLEWSERRVSGWRSTGAAHGA
jgi:hypothetical protein